MGCTTLIKEGLASLTETGRRLADYLLWSHSGEVTRMNAKGLPPPAAPPRRRWCASPRARFQRLYRIKAGPGKESGAEALDEFQTVIQEHDDLDTILQKAELIHLKNTSLTYRMVNVSVLNQAVEEICAGRRIHLFGIGPPACWQWISSTNPPASASPPSLSRRRPHQSGHRRSAG